MSRIVLTVGSVLRGDDAAGPMLAKMMSDDPVVGWSALDGGQMPEDYLSVIRKKRPDVLVMVDAADMGLPVGEVRLLAERDMAHGYLTTTHSLPLSLLLSELRGCCGEVVFIGIQPAQTEFFAPLSPEVLASVERIYACLGEGSAPITWFDSL